MTLDQAIKSIITQPGVDRVTFGISEKDGKPIVLCEQVVQARDGIVMSKMQHIGDTHEEALEGMVKMVKHGAQLQKSDIVKIKDN
jgi:hypothetical protein